MSNNRDYKTHARRVSANLAKHAVQMAELIKIGKSHEQASKQAFAEIRAKQ